MRLHNKQYLIGPEPVMVGSDWSFIKIEGVGFLSHCPNLIVESCRAADGSRWTLLGLAVQTAEGMTSPVEQIATATKDTVSALTHTWAGRWVLIGDGMLRMDAMGLLGCFYRSRQPAQLAPGFWVSSSSRLLGGKIVDPKRKLEHMVGVEWYPPPLSRFSGVFRLLPSQILNLVSGAVSAKSLTQEIRFDSYGDVLDRLQSILTTGIRNLANRFDNLWLPLTAGHDSRLLLSILAHCGVRVQTYTQLYWDMTKADRQLPAALSKLAGFQHLAVKPGRFDSAMATLHDSHTGCHSFDRDRDFICSGQFEWCQSGDVLVRGSGLELGCPRAVSECFPGTAFCADVPDVSTILRGYNQGPESSVTAALIEWRNWCQQSPHKYLDWRDRFYIEQESAGWASSTAQSLDLIRAEQFYLSSCEDLIAAVLQVPSELREQSRHQVDLIKRMAPQFAAFPINARDPLSHRARRKLQRHWRSVKRKFQYAPKSLVLHPSQAAVTHQL